VNIGEIAKRAGVSRSTVSYMLSGKRPVSEEVRARVERVIRESGYRPSATARALAQGSTRAFGLVVPPMGGHLSIDQLHFVGSVAEAAADHDYDVLLSPSGREEAFDRMLGERRVDAVIVMETVLHDARWCGCWSSRCRASPSVVPAATPNTGGWIWTMPGW
jgi:DNA-binding LacI/PurR family transcriptional regulator